GAAELAGLLQDYRGNHILTFAGYNAGRGRVQDWIAVFGDPRDPKVDPIDWVERIPFMETRNYVQRVLENMQVYRARFCDMPLLSASRRRHSPIPTCGVTCASTPRRTDRPPNPRLVRSRDQLMKSTLIPLWTIFPSA